MDWQAERHYEQLRARAKGQGKPNGRRVYHLQRTQHGLVFVTDNVTQAWSDTRFESEELALSRTGRAGTAFFVYGDIF